MFSTRRWARAVPILTAAAQLAACAPSAPAEPVLEPEGPLVTIIPIVEPPSAAITVPMTAAPPGATTVPGTLSQFCQDPFSGGAAYCAN